MVDNTLYPPSELPKEVEEVRGLTLPEYLIQKANDAAVQGNNDLWMINSATGESHNYSNFDADTRKIASSMYKRGLRKGDTVIYMIYDLLNIHLFACGVWRANGIMRASYPEDDEATLLSRVEESRAGWILCDPETSKMCLAVAANMYWDVEVIVLGEAEGCTSLRDLFEDDGLELPSLKVTPSDTALVLCTSGTTGRSKGAAHSHQVVLTQIAMLSRVPFSVDKPNFLVSKGTHITGVLLPLIVLSAGRTCLVMDKITKANLFRAIDTYKPGFIFGFPTFLLALATDPEAKNYDLSSIEIMASGGAPVTPAIENMLLTLPNVKTVFKFYGLTEVCPVSADFDFGSTVPAKIPGTPQLSVGKLVAGVQVQIRNLDNHEPLGPNKTGEICVKSQALFTGYYKNPEATKNAIIDDWFYTGDVGYYDENGFLYLVDRIKEIFKYYNNHISPTELEDVIAKHPSVAEVCVIGIPDPDGGDHVPRAFVTVKTGERLGDGYLAVKIQNFTNDKLPSYKHLRGGVFIVPELPKGKTGKVTRQLVAQLPVPI